VEQIPRKGYQAGGAQYPPDTFSLGRNRAGSKMAKIPAMAISKKIYHGRDRGLGQAHAHGAARVFKQTYLRSPYEL